MSIIKSSGIPLPTPPDDVTIPQFLLDGQHPLRQVRTGNLYKAPWLIDDETGKGYGFEELRSRTHGIANAIKHRWNLLEDDVACIFSPNNIDYPTTIWGVLRLGAAVTCANPSYTEPELQYQLETVKVSLVIAHPICAKTALAAAKKAGIDATRVVLIDHPPKNAPAEIKRLLTIHDLVREGLEIPAQYEERKLAPREGTKKIAFYSFSSGTTGKPKAVAIPHYSVISNVLQFAAFNQNNDKSISHEDARFRPGDVSTGALPFFHIYGLVVSLHTMLFCGLTIVVFPKFVFTDFLKSLVKYKITHLFVVPPMVVLFVKHPETRKYDLSRIRYCMAGAAPVSAELTKQFHAVLPKCFIGQGYGMTETSTVVTMPPISQKAGGTLGSAGQLISGTQAKVVKEDGTLAKTGEMGELYLRGPQMQYNQYYNNPAANAETFVDGWVRTGDEVMFAENGDMFIVDRLKELIKCRGFQVAPAELEGHLLDHPDCGDVGVVGVPHEYSGEVPMAFVVLSASAAKRVKQNPKEAEKIKESLKKHVSDAKIRYKWLDGGIEFIDVIPKNPSGKLLRRFLRERAKNMVREQSPKSKL